MEKLISTIFLNVVIGLTVFSQEPPSLIDSTGINRLDTAKLHNFTLRGADWAYLTSYVQMDLRDTMLNDFVTQLKSKISSNTAWSTLVTVDSIPLTLVCAMYNTYYRAPASDITQLGTNIGTVLQAVTHPLFVSWRTTQNEANISAYEKRRWNGARFLKN